MHYPQYTTCGSNPTNLPRPTQHERCPYAQQQQPAPSHIHGDTQTHRNGIRHQYNAPISSGHPNFRATLHTTLPCGTLRRHCHMTRGVLQSRPRGGLVHLVRHRPRRVRCHLSKTQRLATTIPPPLIPGFNNGMGIPPPRGHEDNIFKAIYARLPCKGRRNKPSLP